MERFKDPELPLMVTVYVPGTAVVVLLKYNVLAQNIVAESSEQGSQRVHIIITPPPSKP